MGEATFGLTRSRLEHPIYYTQCKHANHFTSDHRWCSLQPIVFYYTIDVVPLHNRYGSITQLMLFHYTTDVVPLHSRCGTIIPPMLFHYTTDVVPLHNWCCSITPPMLFHYAADVVPLHSRCGTITPPMWFHYTTDVVPLHNWCCSITPPMLFHYAADVVPLYHLCGSITQLLLFHYTTDVVIIYYNPSKFSMDNAWTSKPTCAYMTMEIPTSNKHRTSRWTNQSGDSNWPRHTEHVQTSNQIMFNTHASRVQWVD